MTAGETQRWDGGAAGRSHDFQEEGEENKEGKGGKGGKMEGRRKRKPEGPLRLINGSTCTRGERARGVLRGLKSSSIRQMRGQEGGLQVGD